MKKALHLFGCLAFVVGVWACERPESPNFKLDHEIQVPLTEERKYAFLGEEEAFIDTTTTDVSALLANDGSGLLILTPFNFPLFEATLEDTLDADLSTFPDEEDEQALNEVVITLNYINELPLHTDIKVEMIDENGDLVTRKDNIEFDAADTNSQGEVTEGGEHEGKTGISFSDDELKQLYRTRSIVIKIDVDTNLQQTVRLYADDGIKVRIQVKAGITTTVD